MLVQGIHHVCIRCEKSEIEKVKEFVNGGQDIYPWLTAQGADIDISRAFTLIGCLWQRENSVKGGTVDGEFLESKWGAYFAVPANTITKANDANEIMTRTTAYELIEKDGKVTGVKAKKFDGTEVVAHANKGVILATGGYGANIAKVQETNDYWDDSFIAEEQVLKSVRRPGKKKVVIVKEIMGQGAMHDNFILPVEPVGTS